LKKGNTNIGVEGAKVIGNALKINSSLKYLNLCIFFTLKNIKVQNNIGDLGAIAISEGIKKNSNLNYLNIGIF